MDKEKINDKTIIDILWLTTPQETFRSLKIDRNTTPSHRSFQIECSMEPSFYLLTTEDHPYHILVYYETTRL
jgi:hypothetical protein